jgi:hypothetical protein
VIYDIRRVTVPWMKSVSAVKVKNMAATMHGVVRGSADGWWMVDYLMGKVVADPAVWSSAAKTFPSIILEAALVVRAQSGSD